MPAQLKRRLTVFLVAVGLIALAFFLHWWFIGRHVESTDNAYVQGEITRVASQLGARVEEVLVRDNQHVDKGQLLVRLEDADVNASQATLGRAQIDLNRAEALRKPGYVSEERVTTLTADNHVARSQLAKARADLEAQRVQRDTLGAEIKRLEAQIASARTELAQAEINLSRTLIHSPISGLVGQRSARNGQYVQVGTHLLSLVPDEDIWVQANFKETQVGRMRDGQKARLTFDAFPDTPIDGRIDSLFAASGAQFSLLPPDNATGNFTKVVQRIPVKIVFEADNPLHGRIRPGMSVEAEVELRDR